MHLQIHEITKTSAQKILLDDLEWKCSQKGVYGLLGDESSGKRELFYILSGYTRPDKGKIFLDAQESSIKERKSKISYIPPKLSFYPDIKVKEYLEAFVQVLGIPRKKRAYRVDEEWAYLNWKDKENYFLHQLSYVQQKKLYLAVRLLADPSILLLDHFIEDLQEEDYKEMEDYLECIQNREKIVIISSANLSCLSPFCYHIAILKEGKILKEGILDDILDDLYQVRLLEIEVLSEVEKTKTLLNTELKVNHFSWKGKKFYLNFSGTAKDQFELLQKLLESGVPILRYEEVRSKEKREFLKLGGTAVIGDD
ncbi:hypothetical protein FACS189418_4630 [Clostridia bacterium]|nr:hypothetical protein FACS189418_4630 [Clostridia bacterium]